MQQTKVAGVSSEYRRVEYRVWYKSPSGGSLLEIANDDVAFQKIRDRLSRQQIVHRVSRYYFVL